MGNSQVRGKGLQDCPAALIAGKKCWVKTQERPESQSRQRLMRERSVHGSDDLQRTPLLTRLVDVYLGDELTRLRFQGVP